MIVSIMQPAYLPWLGYFDRMARADLHIVLDHVQIEHNTRDSFTNRNRVRIPAGTAWLTVPIFTSGDVPSAIDEVRIDTSRPWRRKHWNTLRSVYGRARHFAAYSN